MSLMNTTLILDSPVTSRMLRDPVLTFHHPGCTDFNMTAEEYFSSLSLCNFDANICCLTTDLAPYKLCGFKQLKCLDDDDCC
jgi:hypothetical protein